MKILRATILAVSMLIPVAAVASPAVRAACPMGCCGDTCPAHCPMCPNGAR